MARRSPPRESSCPRAAKPRHPAAAGVAAPRYAVQGRQTPPPPAMKRLAILLLLPLLAFAEPARLTSA